jgi:hypothetical protein
MFCKSCESKCWKFADRLFTHGYSYFAGEETFPTKRVMDKIFYSPFRRWQVIIRLSKIWISIFLVYLNI